MREAGTSVLESASLWFWLSCSLLCGQSLSGVARQLFKCDLPVRPMTQGRDVIQPIQQVKRLKGSEYFPET